MQINFFIEKILDHHGLLGCFSQISTNPSFVDDEGRLRIFPYHDLNTPPHGCHLCPPNLCKVNTFSYNDHFTQIVIKKYMLDSSSLVEF